ncbi:hypothetical protein [Luteitalea sp.]|uniref:hypothetical protein n=1 Tax=Luteitalea sp. TaxID=2004800 RepID=UPI0025C44C76|nr:hypothetical protein [Luteitalea sp.]
MASLSEFLAAMTRQETIVAWLTLRGQQTTWTAVGGGAPNAYQSTLAPRLGAAQIAGGVYAKVTRVIENATVLTAQTSLANVNSNAGSWYHDEAAGLLYLRTTGGGDPDTYTMIAVERELTLSTTGILLNDTDGNPATGRYYFPWLVSDLSSILQEAEDVLQGRKLFPEGDLTIASVGGFLHTLIAVDSGYTWENTRIRFAVGGSYAGGTLLLSQFGAIGTLAIYRVEATDDTSVTFKVRPISAGPLSQPAQPTPIFASEYPNLGDGVSGTRKPIGYGRGVIRPPLVDTSGYGTYLLADAAFQTLSAVHRVEAVPKSGGPRVGLFEGVHWSANLTACTLTLLSAEATAATHEIDVELTGKPGLTTFGDIALDLLQSIAGVPAADIDTASFTDAAAAHPAELSVWLLSGRSLSSVISTSEPGQPSLERSVHGTVTVNRSGLWVARLWAPPKDVSAVAVLRKEQCAGVSFHHRDERLVVGRTYVYYAQSVAQGTWQIATHADAAKQYLNQTDDALEVYTFLRNPANAEALAQRYQLLFGTAVMEADVAEMGASQLLSELHDPVLVTYSPAPATGGAYTNRVFQFVRLERLYAPMLGVRAGLFDVEATGLARNLGVWQATAYPNWASSSAAQREASGYWTDANGDPGSGGTYVGRSKWG